MYVVLSVAKNGCTKSDIFWHIFNAGGVTAILGKIRYACDSLTLVATLRSR